MQNLRRRARRVGVALVGVLVGTGAGCSSFSEGGAGPADPDAVAPRDAGTTDADVGPPDAGPVDPGTCAPTAPFDFVAELTGADEASGAINTAAGSERGARLTPDERTLYFHRESGTRSVLLVASRPAANGPFGAPAPVLFPDTVLDAGPSAPFDANPFLEVGGGYLYFDSDRSSFASSKGLYDHSLWRARRATSGAFGAPEELVNVARPAAEPFVRGDEMFFTRTPASGAYTIARAQPVETAGANLPDGVNAPNTANTHPVPSADGLALYFARKTMASQYQIFVARRASLDDPFGAAEPLPPAGVGQSRLNMNTSPGGFAQSPVSVSPDGCRLYFEKTATPPGTAWDLFVATRRPAPAADR